MQKLRLIHLYLGCLFAPLIVFFSLSGAWQTLGLGRPGKGGSPGILAYLSTLHTGGHLRAAGGTTLSSPLFKGLAVATAAVLVLTIVLGVILAFRYGRGGIALICLVVGIVVPFLLVLAR